MRPKALSFNFTDIPQYTNFDLQNIQMPIDVNEFHRLLMETNYDRSETRFLVDGFTNGFSIGYASIEERADMSDNIPLTVGDSFEMWKKIMKEVKLGRFTGPFSKPPFKNFIQSPIRLVPKANNQTRLIFHLSYNFKNGNPSLNALTPKEICTVKYEDLDVAVENVSGY